MEVLTFLAVSKGAQGAPLALANQHISIYIYMCATRKALMRRSFWRRASTRCGLRSFLHIELIYIFIVREIWRSWLRGDYACSLLWAANYSRNTTKNWLRNPEKNYELTCLTSRIIFLTEQYNYGFKVNNVYRTKNHNRAKGYHVLILCAGRERAFSSKQRIWTLHPE